MKSNIKTTLVIISLFIVIILSGILSISYLKKSCDKLETYVKEASTSVSNKQWTNAEIQLLDFEEQWKKTKYGWAMLLDHFEIDNIDDSFTKSKKYIESQDFSSALAELETLKHYIEHIPTKESFSLENIL